MAEMLMSTSSNNRRSPNSCHAIIWTDDGIYYWRAYASLRLKYISVSAKPFCSWENHVWTLACVSLWLHIVISLHIVAWSPMGDRPWPEPLDSCTHHHPTNTYVRILIWGCLLVILKYIKHVTVWQIIWFVIHNNHIGMVQSISINIRNKTFILKYKISICCLDRILTSWLMASSTPVSIDYNHEPGSILIGGVTGAYMCTLRENPDPVYIRDTELVIAVPTDVSVHNDA